MKKFYLLLAIVPLLAQFTFSQDIYKGVSISNPTENTINQLDNLGIDLSCGVVFKENEITLELFEVQLDQLEASNINYTVLIDDMQAFYSKRAIEDLPKAKMEIEQAKALSAQKSYSVNEIIDNVGQYNDCDEINWAVPANWNLNPTSSPNSFGGCLTYAQVLQELDDMRTAYPNLISVKANASPTSQLTYEGRTVYYVRISDNPDIDEAGEPETLYQSLIHSREAATVMNQLFFMWYLLENYATDTAIKNLVDNQALYFIPVFNPDGFVWNQTAAPDGGGGQRKNRNDSASGSCSTWLEGIDLNRNSEYFWNNGGSSDQSCNDTYMGTAPFSENETQIMKDFFLDHDFHLALNHHSYKNAMLHAYAGTAITNPRPDEYSKYNHDMTYYNRYAHGPSTSISGLNSGNMNDWMLGGPDTAYTGFHGGASLQSGTGSGKNTMAWTPENGLSSEGTGGSYGGFWPQPSNYLPIARRAMRMNFLAAYFSGKYAKLHDLNQSDITTLSGNLNFAIENLGQTASDFTLTVTPVSSNILSVGGPSTQTGMTVLQQNNVNISYTLDAGIQADDEIEFKVVLTNDYASGNVLYEANIVKTYNPNVVFVDNPDTDILTNWSSSGLWSATTTPSYVYSGSRAITSTLSGIYPANRTEQLQMNGSVNLTGMSTVLIQFYAKWDLERSYDYVTIEGSTNGSTWTELCGKLTKPGAPTANNTYSSTNDAGDSTVKTASDDAEQNGITSLYDGDTQDRWNMEEIVIDASTNSFLLNQGTVFLRFNFNTDSSNRKDSYANADFEGFAFDDFKIIEVKIPCDDSNPPTGLTVDIVTPVSAALSWNAIPSATYDLRYRVIGAPSWTTITDIATNSYNLLGLIASTDYEAQIATRCLTSTSAFSSSANFTTTTAASCTGSSVSTYPYTEDFETGVGLWTQDGADDIDWTRDSAGTPSSGTGPSSGDGDTWYMYTEASGTAFPSKVANLISPCFDLTAKTNPQFSYSYHMLGTSVGSLNVQVSTDNGANYYTLRSYSGNLGDVWNQDTIDLSIYENQIIKIRFNATTGTSWSSDIAIDKINFTAVNGTIWYQDFDADTFGNPAVSQVSIPQPPGYVADNTDCNDTDAAINPNTVWYLDFDNDLYAASTVTQCANPGAGYTLTGMPVTDCDDSNNAVNPAATEICDGIDNNCVGGIDEGVTNTYYADTDSDTYGDPGSSIQDCSAPAGYVANNMDCDDTDAAVNPAATEICDGIDNDCDGLIDDADPSVTGQSTWHADNDADGFGDAGDSLVACNQPAGYVSDNTDCDDTDNTVNPAATEICDGIDNDCDGLIDDADPSVTGQSTWYADTDADGFGDAGDSLVACNQPAGYVSDNTDCDDTASAVNPAATEICDGIDNDCDGLIDDAYPSITGQSTWYADTDGDTYGDPGNTTLACNQPAGYVSDNTDCDDTASAVNPAATEVCDGIDNDCDGLIDDADPSVTGKSTWYADTDGDTYGDPGNTTLACNQPAGYVSDNTDCDDTDNTVNPAATEICDGIDNDCDGLIDDADPSVTGQSTWYADTDGDTYGDPGNTTLACNQPAGYVSDNTDCDDTASAVNPAATEVCDGIDNDCDGLIDDADPSVTGQSTWYADTDGDTYGDPGNTTLACNQPAGYVSDNTDCDDTASAVNPAATEICDGIDNDCDGLIDDADPSVTGQSTWYADNDADGFGDAGDSLVACNQPAGYVSDNTDCDDTASAVNPAATEVCDGIDNDCDGLIDDADPSVTGQSTWYADTDGDTYGDPGNTTLACNQPAGYVSDNTDCDDTSSAVNPAATEICDGIDNDCDGLIDDADPSVTGQSTWYADTDADGFGDAADSLVACNQPAGYVSDNTDCDDTASAVNPAATEICDGIDNDCDGLIDDADPSVTGQSTWYADTDADGFGDAGDSLVACNQPAGYVADNTDCDDTASAVNPAATEICDGIDNDCDGLIDDADPSVTGQSTWYADTDADGFGDAGDSLVACNQPAGYVSDNTDCDDTASAVNPAATEVCDGIDNDCDGLIDDADPSVTGQSTWYADNDADGFGDAGDSLVACNQPAGYVSDNTDCDDTDNTVNPAATEICDGIDNDCDGLIDDADPSVTGQSTWYADTDADGFGDAGDSLVACNQPAGYVSDNTDCDDTSSAVNPAATEICDGIDNDCDGLIDDADPSVTGQSTWYADTDADGFGDAGDSLVACNQPAGYVADNTDCDDTASAVNPAATEVCDGIDNDCDGLIDDADPSVTGQSTWYADTDADGFGDAGDSLVACNQPAGYVSDNTDCDDTDNTVNPAATEVCDGIDNDCDGLIDDADPSVTGQSTWYADNDADGFGDAGDSLVACNQPAGYVSDNTDCDDTDNTVNPAATEICDGIDNDCDGLIDDADPSVTGQSTWYADTDADGFGDAGDSLVACNQPAGYVSDNTDCDDTNNTVYPGAPELCDGLDNDCNTFVDDGITFTNYYADTDGDTYGDPGSSVSTCDGAPAGYVSDNTDCDDTASAVNPAATEVCDGIDNDCDGLIDDADPSVTGQSTWYADNDADGFGDAGDSLVACNQPAGYVSDNTDCDDTDNTVNPAATEVCDGIDNDCDGLIDDADPSVTGQSTWYADNDADGFGDAGDSLVACNQPAGYVSDNTDCDDTDNTVNPAATEICDGIDNDCDGLIDDADPSVTGQSTWYADTDADGFGDAADSLVACNQPAGYVSDNTDCDDTDNTVNPAATEICDGIDNDCDGLIDDADPSVTGKSTWYADTDGDTYGDPGNTTLACNQPAGYVSDNTDCDDTASAVNPAATEVCDGIDNDCDGLIDDADPSVTGQSTWYADNDADGFGDAGDSLVACNQPAGYVSDNTDCDDTNNTVYPGAPELCDGLDNDCNTFVDDGITFTNYYADTDGDTYGDPGSSVSTCDGAPAGYVSDNTDCDDTASAVNPAATEVCDGIDNDCDGLIDDADPSVTGQSTWYADNDADGFGDAADSLVACNQPAGYVSDNTDCDDTASAVNPAATEICDGIDNDCDGLIDDADPSVTGQSTWYADTDADGFGDAGDSLVACNQPAGYVADNTDCDDTASAVNPAATEICDGIDNDCDGLIDDADPSVTGQSTWYADTDADGFGDAGDSLVACNQPAGYVSDNTDCDDTASAVNPAATEVCDGIDNDCDGLIDDADPSVTGQSTWYADNDADGFGDAGDSLVACNQPAGYVSDNTDCDDTDNTVNPAATEICDGIDNDCDGLIDDADPSVTGQSTWYADTDADGFGDAGDSLVACNQPAGYVSDNTDCDDTNNTVYPGAPELCDGLDNDCNTFVDDGITFTNYYADTDGDTYGDPGSSVSTCDGAPAGYVSDNTDCDDTASAVNPAATEVCDGIDNDCDGLIDDADPSVTGQSTWYADNDADGFGDAGDSLVACNQPAGYVSDNTDCDDTDNTVNPAATEVCDGIDNDCDGLIDDADPSVTGQSTWYADNDADGFGDAGDSLVACNQPAGYVSDNTDCDDTDNTVNPAATEVCDGIDNDCDGLIDDADPSVTGQSTWYADTDADGFGDAADSLVACNQPAGYVSDNTDCDDTDNTVNPAATEICDGIDNDCDGLIDDADPSVTGKSTWYADTDGDTYGDPGNTTLACNQPAGYVSDNTDCDDTASAVNPAATEVCDGIDNDCDGLIDDADPSVTGQSTWYADTDGDTYGDPGNTTLACNQPAGYVSDNTDCDDTASAVNPAATEVCDGIDNDCDGLIDDADPSVTGQSTWYADTDGDTYGDPGNTTLACNQPAGYVSDNTDCDDTASAVNPAATEICDGIDNDCDGLIDDADPSVTGQSTWYADNDADGFGDAGDSLVACNQPAGYVSDNTDCDDTDNTVNPAATEICDGIDNDCDGLIDDADPSVTGQSTWYADNDADGFGDAGDSLVACNQPAGFVSDNTDCDDTNNTVYPGAPELCDGLDNDCNTFVDDGITFTNYYADTDGDTYGDPGSSVSTCDGAPAGYVLDNTDCDDTASAVNPAATEVCDGIDNDCDGLIDDADPSVTGQSTWYADNDADGFGDAGDSLVACNQPAGYVSDNTDCDDTASAVNPAATEVCDGIDNDCDGLIDDADPSVTGQSTWYADNDADGFGDAGDSLVACNQPAGYVSDNTDCDDTASAVNPAATEICDGIDNDCDGLIDDADPSVTGQSTWYADTDADGFGDAGDSLVACNQPAGYVSDNTDCDDTASAVNPAATEICDGIDNDCDGLIDEGMTFVDYYRDNDSDGYGDFAFSINICGAQPAGFVLDNTDCDDNNATINPGATEIECNGFDENCSGMADDTDSTDPICITRDISIQLDGTGNASILAADVDDGCTDNCGIDTLSVSPSTFNSSNIGDNIVTLTVTDFQGNTSQCTATVTVEDTLGTDDFNSNTVRITPNPFGSYIYVYLPLSFNNSDFDVRIFDLNGRIVFDRTMTSTGGRLEVDGLERLEEAPYFIKITSKLDGNSIYKKLIKHE